MTETKIAAAPAAKAPSVAAVQTPPLVRQQTPAGAPPPPVYQAQAYEELTPAPRAFYASFGEWLATRSPPLFTLMRMARRAVAGAWRRRALTIPAAILLAVPPVVAFLPGFEAERPWLLGAGAFLIALAATAYVAMRMYAFALSTNAETQRLAHQIGALQTLKSALDASVAGVKTELKRDFDQRLTALDKTGGARDATLRGDIDATLKALRADGESRYDSLWRGLGELTENLNAIGAGSDQRAAALHELTAQLAALNEQLDAAKAAAEQRETALAAQIAAAQQQADQREAALRGELGANFRSAQEKIDVLDTAAKAGQQSLLTELKSEIERTAQTTLAAAKKELAKERVGVGRLRERIASSERQIGALRHPSAPSTLVFFGHHKCASRFFRNEVFLVAAEAAGARIRKYEIKDPPFHYSMSDELDLVNMDFNGLGVDGRDVVLFSNATQRSLERLSRATQDWKGIRIIRDPRQVLVSDYFHHKGDHHTELNGWVWDQLAKDKPILRELSEEDGLLYELDSISKQIIETQVLAPFDDPRVMTIKIEDFSTDPKGHLERISDFLGVAHIAGLDFNRKGANPDSGPWRRHFTSKLRAVFKERYGQALIDLGYAEDLHW